MKLVYLYALIDPRTEQIRYIGQTVNPNARLDHHIRHVAQTGAACGQWIRELSALNLVPYMQIIGSAPPDQIGDLERETIFRYATQHPLTNVLGNPVAKIEGSLPPSLASLLLDEATISSMAGSKSKVIQIRLSPGLKKRFCATAEANGMSISTAIQIAVLEYLNRYDNQ